VTNYAQEDRTRYLSFRKALSKLYKEDRIDKVLYYQLDRVRTFRNEVVHQPNKIEAGMIMDYLATVQDALNELKQKL